MGVIDPKDVRIETMRGTGPGGQNRNKRETTVRATHIPTGISAYADGRNQGQNKKKAMAVLAERVAAAATLKRSRERKARRDQAIHDTTTIRTYNFSRGTVKDHRTGAVASIKEVLGKGRFDLLTEGLKCEKGC